MHQTRPRVGVPDPMGIWCIWPRPPAESGVTQTRQQNVGMLTGLCLVFFLEFASKMWPCLSLGVVLQVFQARYGYLVYLAEAAGRERSHPNLPVNTSTLAFDFISASATAATYHPCPLNYPGVCGLRIKNAGP